MRILLMDLKRSFFSRWFFVAVIGITISYFLGDWGDLGSHVNNSKKYYDVLSFFDISRAIGYFSELTILFSALPSAMSFCEDWNSKYIRLLIIRGGIFKYSLSKIISSILSSILAIALGIGLLVLVLSFKIPLVSQYSTNYNTFIQGPFGFLLVQGNYILYFLIQIYFMALVCAILVLIGLIATTYLPNKFLAITTPIVVYFTLMQIGRAGRTSSLPAYLIINKLMHGDYSVGSAKMDLIYLMILFVVSSLLIGYLFYKRVKLNVEKG